MIKSRWIRGLGIESTCFPFLYETDVHNGLGRGLLAFGFASCASAGGQVFGVWSGSVAVSLRDKDLCVEVYPEYDYAPAHILKEQLALNLAS